MHKPAVLAATGAGVVLAITASGAALATDGDDGPQSRQYTRQQAESATAAALEATHGGTANGVETDNENGATYEVEVTKTDGSTVDVRLDEAYKVVVIEGDTESGNN